MLFHCELYVLSEVVNQIRLDVLHPISLLNTMLSQNLP